MQMNRFFASRWAALLLFLAALLAAKAVYAAAATPNDTARFLAGMTVDSGSPLEALTKERPFIDHAAFFERAWSDLDARQLSKVRAWSSENLKTPRPAMFYMFSGPDFLYANAFFPKADTYVMSGLELIGGIPDVSTLPGSVIPYELAGLRASLSSVFNYSFFITRQMRTHLYGRRLTGILPVIFVFLARSGKTIESVSFVELDKDGGQHPAGEPTAVQDKKGEVQGAKGVKITFTDEDKRPRTLYYFTTDLSNRGAEKSGFLEFCEKLGTGDSLLKSASYLPQSANFSRVRNFILTHSATIVQDDTGVPLRDFDLKEWDIKPFGNYVRPIEKFPGKYQPDLHSLFLREHAEPLQFSIGYRWRNGSSSMLLAKRKSAGRQQAASDAPAKANPPVMGE